MFIQIIFIFLKEAVAQNTPFFLSHNLMLCYRVTQPLLTSSNLSCWSHTISLRVMKPLFKSSNPPHQLISIIPLQMFSSFSFSSHLALSKYFPSTIKSNTKRQKQKYRRHFQGEGRCDCQKAKKEENEEGPRADPCLEREF